MNILKSIRIWEIPSKLFNDLLPLLLEKPQESHIYPDGKTGHIYVKVAEGHPDFGTALNFCITHKIRYNAGRIRTYTRQEEKEALFSFVRMERTMIADRSIYELDSSHACPRCGIGKCLQGSLRIKMSLFKKDLQRVTIGNDDIWIISMQLLSLIKDFKGYNIGCIYDHKGNKSDKYFRLNVDNVLPRMAKITNYESISPVKCKCNRGGWVLRDEMFYSKDIFDKSMDFNLTIERFNDAQSQSLIVSKKARDVIREYTKKYTYYEPIHIIEQDPPGAEYKFDLPLDCPNQT